MKAAIVLILIAAIGSVRAEPRKTERVLLHSY